MRELIGLFYSPWTEKAKWALDYHQLPYTYKEHLMIFDMPFLRFKLRRPFGDVTVPALIDGPIRLTDSWDIARYAENLGKGKKIFPENHLKKIQEFNEWSEQALSASRVLMTEKISKDPEALMTALPKFIPEVFRKYFLFMAKIGLGYIQKEFDTKSQLGCCEEKLRKVFEILRKSLAQSKTGYLLDELTYADIAMAVSLQFISPISERYQKIPDALRRCEHHEKLAKEFSDLIKWRDLIYQKHRF